MKRLLTLITLAVLGCSFPVQLTYGTPTPIPTLTSTPAPTQTPPATPEIGAKQNPLILALAPSTQPSDAMVKAGDVISAFIEKRTGYKIVTVVPPTEALLVEAFAKGNAHIGSLTPYGYLLARENGSVTALLAQVHDGGTFYDSQIIANRDEGLTSYFDVALGANTTEDLSVLKQLDGMKACWSDAKSASAYVVPLGLLNQAGVQIRSEAFLAGQPNVVRGVYVNDICNFGATYVDARDLPVLEADYGDVMDKVRVIWRIPKIIPYENISMSTSIPLDMRRIVQRAFIDLMGTPEGKAAIQTVYGIDQFQVVEDSAYDEFAKYVKASKLDMLSLLQ